MSPASVNFLLRGSRQPDHRSRQSNRSSISMTVYRIGLKADLHYAILRLGRYTAADEALHRHFLCNDDKNAIR